MERELWTLVVGALRRTPPTRPRNAVYTDRQILAVVLWAALHDRPVSWACRRGSWPFQAWRRAWPDQSTVSRRMGRLGMLGLLERLLDLVQGPIPREEGVEVRLVDAKAHELPEHSRDQDARVGRGAGRMSRGYKTHVLLSPLTQRVNAYETTPMNAAETTVAAGLLARAPLPAGVLVLGDAGYDSNPLHRLVRLRGGRLIAPRKRPGAGLGAREHDPGRLESMRWTEGAGAAVWEKLLKPIRVQIERFFGAWTSFGGGLGALPPWARGLHYVRLWVAAKLCINAARIRRLQTLHA